MTERSCENYFEGREGMQYTITQQGCPDRVYRGFGTMQNEAKVFAVAVFDGDNDLYAVDEAANLDKVADEIDRLYRDDYDRGPSHLQFYRRIERG